MIQLTDYLYEGHTIIKILHRYIDDLSKEVEKNGNVVDKTHCLFLQDLTDILEHNDFLTSQSQRIREFYKLMADKYPFLAFTFRGRIKSLLRAEEKFNGYIVRKTYKEYLKSDTFPDVSEICDEVSHFRDLIAYRIVISLPKCHVKEGEDIEELEERYLYEIANILPSFMKKQGFIPEKQRKKRTPSTLLNEDVREYYRDYIADTKKNGYRSLHISFFDSLSKKYFEIQLRTKEMDDFAEIGEGNHSLYEERQQKERSQRNSIPHGMCGYFDEAYVRGMNLQNINLRDVDVNMFTAFDNLRMNDGCGFVMGRLILPYEHLSEFQNDVID